MAAAEIPFRVITTIFAILSVSIRIYFQRRARSVEKVSGDWQRQDRSPYRLPTYASLFGLLYIFTPWVNFAHLPFPKRLRWLGVVIGGLSVTIFGWTHWTLGTNWSGKLELSNDHTLVTQGPYRYVRHPMYTSFFLSGIGALLATANWFVALPLLISYIWMYLGRVASEEEMMVEHFGDAYRHYMARTGRLLPRWPR